MALGQVSYASGPDLGAYLADGVYPLVLPAQAQTSTGPDSGLSGIVGGAAWNQPNVPLGPIGDSDALYDLLGLPNSSNPHDAVTCAALAMGVTGGNVQGRYIFVRTTDGTDVAANIPVLDAGVGATEVITLSGSPAKGDIVTLILNSPTATITIAGSPQSGDLYSFQLGLSAPVTFTGASTVNAVATGLAAAINTALGVAGSVGQFVYASATGAVITLFGLTGPAAPFSMSVGVTPTGHGTIVLSATQLQPLSPTLPLVKVSFTVGPGDLTHVSKSLQQAVNASNAVIGPTAFLAPINPGLTASFTLQALQPGAGGNSISAIGYVSSGAGVAVSAPTTPTAFSGGGIQGTLFDVVGKYTGSRANGGTVKVVTNSAYNPANAASAQNPPTFDIELVIPKSFAPEYFRGIVGWKLSSNQVVYDAPTFIANAISAINNGIANGRVASSYWTAVPYTAGSPSTLAPLLNTTFNTASTGGSLGTDGSAGLTSTQLIGTDGVSSFSRTGMFSLRETGVFQFTIAGLGQDPALGDLPSGLTAASFAQSEASFFVGPCFPTGTDTPTAVSDRANNNLTSIYQCLVKDFVNFTDPVAGTVRATDPLGEALGTLASLLPAQSLGNKPYLGLRNILSTERTVKGGQGAYSTTEAGTLASAGITAISAMNRSAQLLGFLNGQNAAGSSAPGQNGIEWTRTTNFILRGILQVLGPFVDELQGATATDATRNAIRTALNRFFASMKANNQIVDFKVVCDLTNNSQATIAQGFCNVSIQVTYFGVARFIVPTIQGGAGVFIPPLTNSLAQTPTT